MKVSKKKSFVAFMLFCMFAKLFLYESSRWHCSNTDLRESMRDSAKVFCEGLCVQLAMKFFLPQNFYGIQ